MPCDCSSSSSSSSCSSSSSSSSTFCCGASSSSSSSSCGCDNCRRVYAAVVAPAAVAPCAKAAVVEDACCKQKAKHGKRGKRGKNGTAYKNAFSAVLTGGSAITTSTTTTTDIVLGDTAVATAGTYSTSVNGRFNYKGFLNTTTGTFKIPCSGKYQLNFQYVIGLASGTSGAIVSTLGDVPFITLSGTKSGDLVTIPANIVIDAATDNNGVLRFNNASYLQLSKGDVLSYTLTIPAAFSTSAVTLNPSTTATDNTLSVVRLR